jgi:hypothetical protein
MLNLASLLENGTRKHPGRDAVVLGDTRRAYRDPCIVELVDTLPMTATGKMFEPELAAGSR